MRKRNILLKIILYGLFLLLFYLLQTALFPRLAIGGVKPLILPVAVVGIALYEGSVPGALAGLAAGLLCDISMTDSIAVFILALTVIGALVGFLSQRFLRRGLLGLGLCALLALILCAFFQAFGLVFFHGAPSRLVFLRALWQTLYSLLFTLPVWALVRPIAARFRKV